MYTTISIESVHTVKEVNREEWALLALTRGLANMSKRCVGTNSWMTSWDIRSYSLWWFKADKLKQLEVHCFKCKTRTWPRLKKLIKWIVCDDEALDRRWLIHLREWQSNFMQILFPINEWTFFNSSFFEIRPLLGQKMSYEEKAEGRWWKSKYDPYHLATLWSIALLPCVRLALSSTFGH